MAFVHGKNAVFKLDVTGGTLTDFSDSLDNVNFAGQRELADVTSFGDDDRAFIQGLRTGSFDISGQFDTDAADVTTEVMKLYTADSNTNFDFEYGPGGSSSGYQKITGKCIVTAFQIGSNVSDKVTFSFTAQVTGEITVGTY